MLKRLLITLILITSFISALTTIKIEATNYPKINDSISNTKIIKTDQIGELIIDKINLKEPLFNINSEENTIEKHVTILKESIFPDNDNSIMFIAAHSGTGKIAYFEELDQLQINDEIKLILNNREYIYIVKNIWEQKKNGYINVNKENNKQLILTTCSPTKKDYQLIVNCIKKEFN